MLPTITNSSARVRSRLKRVTNITPRSRDRPCYHPAVSKQMMNSASNNRCLQTNTQRLFNTSQENEKCNE